jgi:Fe(3+) dicitrate transport protein
MISRRGPLLLLLAVASPAVAQSAGEQAPPVAQEQRPLTPEEEEALLAGLEGEFIDVMGKPVDVSRVGGSAHLVGEEQLARYEYDDIHRVLKQVPGVYIREEDGYGLRPNIGLRGAASDRSAKVTLMEDGVLMGPAPYSAPAAYYFPLVTRMTAMEVFKGPAAVKHGPQTVGGAINLRTRTFGKGMQGEVDLGAGLYGTGKAHGAWSYGGERAGILLEGVRLGTDGFKQLDGGGETGFSKDELMLKAHVSSAPGAKAFQRLELKLGYSDERSYETYLGLTDEDFALNPQRRYVASQKDRMDWRRFQYQLSHLLSLGYGLEVRTTVYRHEFSRAWRRLNGFRRGPALESLLQRPDTGQAAIYTRLLRGELDSASEDEALLISTNDRQFVSQGLQVAGRWRPLGGLLSHSIEFGARLHYDSIDRFHTEDGFLMRSGAMVADGRSTQVATNNRASTRALALYVHDEILIGDLVVAPGARMEVIHGRLRDRMAGRTQEGMDVVLLPGVGAVWQATHALSVLAGVHQGFSPRSPGQSEEVRAEKSLNYELGARYGREGVRAELVGFLNDYANLTGECTFSTGCRDEQINQQFNAGRVHVYGLEAGFGAERPGPLGLTLRTNVTYTLTLSNFLTDFVSENPQFGQVRAGDALPYVPVHQGALSAGVAGRRWEVDASASYMGAMREQASQGALLPGQATDSYMVVDLAGNFQVSEHSKLYVTGNNLLNAAYIVSRRPFGARPGMPRQVQVGFKHHF